MKPSRPEMKEERKRSHPLRGKHFFPPAKHLRSCSKLRLNQRSVIWCYSFICFEISICFPPPGPWTRGVCPRASSCSCFEGSVNLSEKSENNLFSRGSINSTSRKYISRTLTKPPHPSLPVSLLWFSCTGCFLFSIVNITISIKRCSCLTNHKLVLYIYSCPHFLC